MLKVFDLELDFDITSPADVMRYKTAGEVMEAAADSITLPTVPEDDPEFINQYYAMLNDELRLFGDFIDEVFGDGIANRLLGRNPSLNRVTDINDALGAAMETQGREYGAKVQKYTPNRATRRKKP